MFYPERLSEVITRRIKKTNINQEVFITFDDGPHPVCTPLVLDLLKKHNAKATFFLILNNVKKYPEITKRIIDEGHTIGNHSSDHNTLNFFKSYKDLNNWVIESEKGFRELGIQTIGFRPPVGINTHLLNKVMTEANIPMILWDTRYYDTLLQLNFKKISRSITKLRTGSIILLHDKHSFKHQENFIKCLEFLICQTKVNYKLSAINKCHL